MKIHKKNKRTLPQLALGSQGLPEGDSDQQSQIQQSEQVRKKPEKCSSVAKFLQPSLDCEYK
jgi:hypothetical protein